MSVPAYIFLDQNHWIYLAKDFWGKPHQDKHRGIAKRLLAKVERDEVRLPLSVLHLIELLRKGEYRARCRLAEVFEIYSRGWFIAHWSQIVPFEISAALAKTFGNPIPEGPAVFGRGFLFGIPPITQRLLETAAPKVNFDALDALAQQPGALFDLLTRHNEANRLMQNENIAQLNSRDTVVAEDLRKQGKPASREVHRRAIRSIHAPVSGPDHKYAERLGKIVPGFYGSRSSSAAQLLVPCPIAGCRLRTDDLSRQTVVARSRRKRFQRHRAPCDSYSILQCCCG
jgi:hypothetical protein